MAGSFVAATPATPLPRMADYARRLIFLDDYYSNDGAGMARNRERIGQVLADSLTADPFFTAVRGFMSVDYEGTSAKLLSDAIAHEKGADPNWRPAKEWPASARGVTVWLKNQAPGMRALGWEVKDLGRGGHEKAVKWRLALPRSCAQCDGPLGATVKSDLCVKCDAWAA